MFAMSEAESQESKGLSGTALCKAVTGWTFANEAALEKFVWEHLHELLGITPLKRQHISNSEICDILAVGSDRALTVVELKNAEDRYLVQQLTRYYANLIAEKPFQAEIDYRQPIRLIGVAPSYHRHNLIDQEYSKLPIELLQFAVLQEQDTFYLRLQTLEQVVVQTARIPYQAIDLPAVENVPDPPALLLTGLGSCSKAEQEGILKLRRRLLSSHPRLKESVEKKTIYYGLGKSKLCAEILLNQRLQKPVLFLRLPTPSTYHRPVYLDGSNEVIAVSEPIIGCLRLWTDGETITHVGHVAEGLGKMKLESEWQQMPADKRPKSMQQGVSSRSHTPVSVEDYLRFPESVKQFLGHPENVEVQDRWELLADLAIEQWLKRL